MKGEGGEYTPSREKLKFDTVRFTLFVNKGNAIISVTVTATFFVKQISV